MQPGNGVRHGRSLLRHACADHSEVVSLSAQTSAFSESSFQPMQLADAAMQQCTNAATVWQIQMQRADTASAMQTRSAQPGNRAT
eukprot:597531-Alexandrium_andersonii.AAC.1